MTITEMTLTGAVMILAVLVIRAVGITKLPKKAFIVMWELCILRLLLPISIPLAILPSEQPEAPNLPAYSAPDQPDEEPLLGGFSFTKPLVTPQNSSSPIPETTAPAEPSKSFAMPKISKTAVWLMGAGIIAAYFSVSYIVATRRFRESLPIKCRFVDDWLFIRGESRRISVRCSDRITSPLTYGLIKPIILQPKSTDLEDEKRLNYILEHEYAHIRHFDAFKKPVAALALCLHWFNPLVWVMYLLYNRDMELWCDECVLKKYGEKSRAAYAKVLIEMEELRTSPQPLLSYFGKNSIEERIVSIMKFKKTTIISAISAVLLTTVITVTIVATSLNPVPKQTDETNIPAVIDSAELDAPEIAEPAVGDIPEDTAFPVANEAVSRNALLPEHVAANNQEAGFERPLKKLSAGSSMQQIHSVYCDRQLQSLFNAPQLKAGDRMVIVYQLDHEATEADKSIFGGIIVNGNSVYYSYYSVVYTGDKVVIPIVAPKDGEYDFWAGNQGREDISIVLAWAEIENSDAPYCFGDIQLNEAAFENCVLTEYTPSDSHEAIGEVSDLRVCFYTDTDGTVYYLLDLYGLGYNPMTGIQALPIPQDAYKKIADLQTGNVITISKAELEKYITAEIERVSSGLLDGQMGFDPTFGKFIIKAELNSHHVSTADVIIDALSTIKSSLLNDTTTIYVERAVISSAARLAPGETMAITDIDVFNDSAAADGSFEIAVYADRNGSVKGGKYLVNTKFYVPRDTKLYERNENTDKYLKDGMASMRINFVINGEDSGFKGGLATTVDYELKQPMMDLHMVKFLEDTIGTCTAYVTNNGMTDIIIEFAKLTELNDIEASAVNIERVIGSEVNRFKERGYTECFATAYYTDFK